MNYSHINSPFYFFKIMTEVLKEYNFICCVGEPEPERSIFIFNKNMLNVEPLRTTFDSQKLTQELKELNTIQSNFGIGMRESAKTLIEIFLSLL